MPQRVVEVVIDVPACDVHDAEQVGWALGAQGLEVRDEDTGAVAGRAQVIVWLPWTDAGEADRARVERAVREAIGHATITFRTIDATWLAPPAPRPIGRRFVVLPLDGAPEDDARVALRLDGSLTFGDGLHPTTALCVEALEDHFEHERVPERVLDVGTGTGILAICAAKLGARAVTATDVDPLARHAARAHATHNGVALAVESALPDARFDVVVANLYAEPLRALAHDLAARVASSGALVISGFGAESRPRIEAAFVDAGLRVVERRSRDGWCCLRLGRATRRR